MTQIEIAAGKPGDKPTKGGPIMTDDEDDDPNRGRRVRRVVKPRGQRTVRKKPK